MVGQQNADMADTFHLRDVAMETTFWLSIGYNFGCVIASGRIFDSTVGFGDQDILWRHSRFRDSKGRCYFLVFYIWGHIGATLRIWLNCPSAAAMRPYVKLLWPLVIIISDIVIAVLLLLLLTDSVTSCLRTSDVTQYDIWQWLLIKTFKMWKALFL